MYTIHKESTVEAELDEVWDFIKNPENLNLITPDELDFKIISNIPQEMYNGLLIEYQVRIPWIGRQLWLTEIKHIQLEKSFVDEQRLGPYKFWHHYHEIREEKNRIIIVDHVTYEVPLGIIGQLVHRLFIRKLLNKIFDYRELKFQELFK